MSTRDAATGLLDALPVAAYMCDPGGRITGFNPPAADLWGRSPARNDPADLYCGSYKLFTPAGDPVPHSRCWMARALHEDKPFLGQPIRVARPDGRMLDALAFATPLHGPDGRLTGGLNLMLDVTADRQAEADIARAVAELRERDRARTVALVGVVMRLQRELTDARPAAGFVPICCHCKAVRDPAGRWHPVEEHIHDRTGDLPTHGICPPCLRRHYGQLLDAGRVPPDDAE
jgi:hypothetical protein